MRERGSLAGDGAKPDLIDLRQHAEVRRLLSGLWKDAMSA